MAAGDIVHLHVHSEYSMLDGFSRAEDLAAHAASLGQPALALTDHGVMYGVHEFRSACTKHGVKPIIGVEAYMAQQTRHDKTRLTGGNYHMLLLATSDAGYRNLVAMTSEADINGFYSRPRIDRDLLAQHHEGIVATSSCYAGEINTFLKAKDRAGAVAAAAYYRDMLGRDRYYLELQRHPGLPVLDELNGELVKIGKELGIPLVATTDAHFVRAGDAEAHRIIKALGFHTTVADMCAKEPLLDDSYHLLDTDAMWRTFSMYGTACLENTVRIADMCHMTWPDSTVNLPDFPLPEGHTASSYLAAVAYAGLAERMGGTIPTAYQARLDYELSVIDETKFPGYMLIVWDYVQFARGRGIPCLPRGSAGGSLVVYSLGISDVDPVQHGLVFERFLNPSRHEMPDIDLDIADTRRAEVVQYLVDTYGREKVAQIATFGTMKAKAAIRDTGRVLGMSYAEVDRVAKLIPTHDPHITLEQALEQSPALAELAQHDASTQELLRLALSVEGRVRNVGMHACGVVVSATPLNDMVPLERPDKKTDTLMAAFEGNTLAKLGFLKLDILGLANLATVDKALRLMADVPGAPRTLGAIPWNDEATLAMLGRGETGGVFQMEGAGLTRYLRELQPSRVEDLFAMVALYRPGPLEQIPHYIAGKQNPEHVGYLHPLLEPILKDTYGVIVYQEQVLQILQAMAGYSLGDADIVRKALGKKIKAILDEHTPKFIQGCVDQGLDRGLAEHLWELIQPFARYSFNRAHATLYGLLSYQTAYLKCNYPEYYMAALLSGVGGDTKKKDTEKVAKAVAECGVQGVLVLPPSVNRSGHDWVIDTSNPEARTLRYGLGAIKHVSHSVVEALIAEREANGLFTSIYDLTRRMGKALGKRSLECLIKVDALADFGNRGQLLAVYEAALSGGVSQQKAKKKGQATLFDLAGETPTRPQDPPLPSYTEDTEDTRQYLEWERDLLGLYLTAHPVDEAARPYAAHPNVLRLADITESVVGRKVRVIALLAETKRTMTKKDKPEAMQFGKLEDGATRMDYVCFPKAYYTYGELLKKDAVVILTGRVDARNGEMQIMVDHVVEPGPGAVLPPMAGLLGRGDLAGLNASFGEDRDMDHLLEEDDDGPGQPSPSLTMVQRTPPAAPPRATQRAVSSAPAHHQPQAPAPTQPASDVLEGTLWVRLPTGLSPLACIALMEKINTMLRGSRGTSLIRLITPPGTGGSTWPVLSPEWTTGVTPAVLAGLKALNPGMGVAIRHDDPKGMQYDRTLDPDHRGASLSFDE